MNMMLWRPRNNRHLLSGIGLCGLYNIAIISEASNSLIECTNRFTAEQQQRVLDKDSSFKGRVEGDPLHHYCIDCLSSVTEELQAFKVGENSGIYE